MQVFSEAYQPFYSIISQSDFITIKKTALLWAASTYEGYSQNQYYYNTKRAAGTTLFGKSLLQPFQKFHRATCT